MAARNSKIYKTPVKQEVILYVIHGILHLLGSDDCSESDKKKMRKREAELLELVKPLI